MSDIIIQIRLKEGTDLSGFDISTMPHSVDRGITSALDQIRSGDAQKVSGLIHNDKAPYRTIVGEYSVFVDNGDQMKPASSPLWIGMFERPGASTRYLAIDGYNEAREAFASLWERDEPSIKTTYWHGYIVFDEELEFCPAELRRKS